MMSWWAWAIAACCRSRAALAAENLCTATTAVAASPQRQRSTFLDLGEPLVPGLARRPRRRECGHGATLAPSRVEGLLALAVETRSKGGSPPYCPGATGLIRRMAADNRSWGQRRIQAELARLGFKVSARTVAKYMQRPTHRRPSPDWRLFLKQHAGTVWAISSASKRSSFGHSTSFSSSITPAGKFSTCM
jgi:hypothetical protein